MKKISRIYKIDKYEKVSNSISNFDKSIQNNKITISFAFCILVISQLYLTIKYNNWITVNFAFAIFIVYIFLINGSRINRPIVISQAIVLLVGLAFGIFIFAIQQDSLKNIFTARVDDYYPSYANMVSHIVCGYAFYSLALAIHPRGDRFLLVILATLFECFYEVLEMISFNANASNLTFDYFDTLIDVINNILGSLLNMFVTSYLFRKYKIKQYNDI